MLYTKQECRVDVPSNMMPQVPLHELTYIELSNLLMEILCDISFDGYSQKARGAGHSIYFEAWVPTDTAPCLVCEETRVEIAKEKQAFADRAETPGLDLQPTYSAVTVMELLKRIEEAGE